MCPFTTFGVITWFSVEARKTIVTWTLNITIISSQTIIKVKRLEATAAQEK